MGGPWGWGGPAVDDPGGGTGVGGPWGWGGTAVDDPGDGTGVGGPWGWGGPAVDDPGGGTGVGGPWGWGGRSVGGPGGCGGGVPIPRTAFHLTIPSIEWVANLFKEDGRNSPDVSRGLVGWTLVDNLLQASRWDTVRLVESGCSILKVNCVDLHG